MVKAGIEWKDHLINYQQRSNKMTPEFDEEQLEGLDLEDQLDLLLAFPDKEKV